MALQNTLTRAVLLLSEGRFFRLLHNRAPLAGLGGQPEPFHIGGAFSHSATFSSSTSAVVSASPACTEEQSAGIDLSLSERHNFHTSGSWSNGGNALPSSKSAFPVRGSRQFEGVAQVPSILTRGFATQKQRKSTSKPAASSNPETVKPPIFENPPAVGSQGSKPLSAKIPNPPQTLPKTSSKPFQTQSEAELLAATAPTRTKSDGTIGLRFYNGVGVEESELGYQVTLDSRPLRSPAKRPLLLPTRELALAIAAEWEWQDLKNIRPFTMPLMKLASTAIDLVPLQRPAIIDNLMKYFKTSDGVCVREPGRGAVRTKQDETGDPILEWMEREFGVRPETSESIFGTKQPLAVVRKVQEVLSQKSDFRLAAIDALASSAHSLVIALAVSRGHLGIGKALEASRIEEDLQIEEWGHVEGGHDLDIADTRVRIAAPSLFLRLLNE